jgi:hypothetical protein
MSEIDFNFQSPNTKSKSNEFSLMTKKKEAQISSSLEKPTDFTLGKEPIIRGDADDLACKMQTRGSNKYRFS